MKVALQVINQAERNIGRPLSLNSPIAYDHSSLGTVFSASVLHPIPWSDFFSSFLFPVMSPPDHHPHFISFEQLDGLLIKCTLL